MDVFKTIEKQSDLMEAINRSFELHSARPGSIEYIELEFLTALIEEYQEKMAARERYRFLN